MAIEVKIPQLGESVTEGTITAWLVQVGERVEADQPLFELSSDKIDTEVPAPASGVLKEIKVDVDETVDVGAVVAVIAEDGEAAAEPQAEATEETAEAEPQAPEEPEAPAEPAPAERPAAQAEPQAPAAEAPAGGYGREGEAAAPAGGRPATAEHAGDGDGEAALMSPLVRRMLAEHDLDPSQVSGTGKGGRITRDDVEAAISGARAEPERPAARAQPGAQSSAPPQPTRRATARPAATGERKRVEDLSRIRQRIAAKMMESLQSSAQLTTVQEADVTHMMRLRSQVKDEFRAREGVSLSPFVFLARAAILALRNHPAVNAQADWEAGKVTYHDYVNLGIAVDTEKGLIVPNVKGADDLSLAGLARAISEAADKARGVAKLEISDIEGGTFTLTNTGSRGVLLDTPILNYPEVAILATGVIQKRPVAIDEDGSQAIAIRDMVYLCLTYDHRLIDGADAARFVTEVAEVIETHDWAAEVGYGPEPRA